VPVSVVVGGQFGSEGKGKVAHWLAGELGAAAAVRVGGSNSGHTVIGPNGDTIVLRQLPTAALQQGVHCVIPPGSYVDVDVLIAEVAKTSLQASRLSLDPHAVLITEDDRRREAECGLRDRIGSTQSGTGAALLRRISRDGTVTFAKHDRRLARYVRPVVPMLRDVLDRGSRVIIEGTQGFGLSLLHGTDYPHVTSRDTSAAAFVAEAGLSPLDVDDIVLVLRAFPIRVPGHSGALPNEIDWATVAAEAKSEVPLVEFTSVTRGIRRVARFDPQVVTDAIKVNRPTRIVLNHLDYVDPLSRESAEPTERVRQFVESVTGALGRRIDYYGFSPTIVVAADVGSKPRQLRVELEHPPLTRETACLSGASGAGDSYCGE
jgi:adenylosuccinate synthase